MMSTTTIRNIDTPLATRLQVRADLHGRSMENAARDILHTALSTEPGSALIEAIRARGLPGRNQSGTART